MKKFVLIPLVSCFLLFSVENTFSQDDKTLVPQMQVIQQNEWYLVLWNVWSSGTRFDITGWRYRGGLSVLTFETEEACEKAGEATKNEVEKNWVIDNKYTNDSGLRFICVPYSIK